MVSYRSSRRFFLLQRNTKASLVYLEGLLGSWSVGSLLSSLLQNVSAHKLLRLVLKQPLRLGIMVFASHCAISGEGDVVIFPWWVPFWVRIFPNLGLVLPQDFLHLGMVHLFCVLVSLHMFSAPQCIPGIPPGVF